MTAVGLREKLGEKRRGATPLRRNSPRQHSARCSPSTFGVVKLIFFSVVQRLSPLPVQTDEVACHMACRFSPLPRLPPLCLHSELLSFGCSFPLGLACHVSRGSSETRRRRGLHRRLRHRRGIPAVSLRSSLSAAVSHTAIAHTEFIVTHLKAQACGTNLSSDGAATAASLACSQHARCGRSACMA